MCLRLAHVAAARFLLNVGRLFDWDTSLEGNSRVITAMVSKNLCHILTPSGVGGWMGGAEKAIFLCAVIVRSRGLEKSRACAICDASIKVAVPICSQLMIFLPGDTDTVGAAGEQQLECLRFLGEKVSF